jgi:hypothetical protein
MAEDALSIWVVYDHPTDWPDWFVARRHVAYGPEAGPTADMILDRDLDHLRQDMEQRGLFRLHRFPEDDAKIVETWL